MTNHDELCEKKWVEQLQLFMDEYGFNVEWSEWAYNDFTALKDWIQLELLHENASLKLKLSDVEKCLKNANALIADQADESQEIVERLQAKLSEAEKELESEKNKTTIFYCDNGDTDECCTNVAEVHLCSDCYEAKLSGSCEGMTIERLEDFITEYMWGNKHIYSGSCLELAKAIHAQMTGGKK